jgi:2-polyprenyl-6-methoxyphenol hydroxylase-like FAD-dependent oxidoreductase
MRVDVSAVIIGGGPAGAVAGRLLAAWGHRVVVLEQDPATTSPASRGRAESIPPSTRKLLAQVGVLEAVDAKGFYQSSGNTVWWGTDDCRVERFGEGRAPGLTGLTGLQVFRPDFDRVLQASATAAGADVRRGARARAVDLDGDVARVDCEHEGRRSTLSTRFVLDCSGRSGVVARRFRVPGLRTCALVGAWRTSSTARGWELPDDTHTVVEAYDRGWAWSVPVSGTTRHAGVMIDGPSLRRGASALSDAYRGELARAVQLERHLVAGALECVWACDASTYIASEYAGENFLLVGDAGSFIDPLSSFGVKKAIASAWIAAIVVNTCLAHHDRRPDALAFFSSWERDVNARYALRSREFARAAAARHPHPFWTRRALAEVAEPAQGDAVAQDAATAAALHQIQQSDELDFTLDERVAHERAAVIRGREIVMEEALPAGLRFHQNVDLLVLARLAGRYRHVPDLVEAYCRASPPVPLPNVLGGLSLLIAKGFLIKKDVVRC